MYIHAPSIPILFLSMPAFVAVDLYLTEIHNRNKTTKNQETFQGRQCNAHGETPTPSDDVSRPYSLAPVPFSSPFLLSCFTAILFPWWLYG